MRGRLLSLLIHAGLLVLLLSTSVINPPKGHTRLPASHVTRLVFPRALHGGGGGGGRSPVPASRGSLPKTARQVFTPPSATPRAKALLIMEPALVAEVRMAPITLPRLGDPLGREGPASDGPGSGGGIGDGRDGGVGGRRGPGYGSHDGGGFDSGEVTGSLTAPVLVYKVEPEFSEEARKAKYQGTVLLALEVGEDGNPQRLRVVRGLGLGLDEKAIEAVSRWRFRPARRNGRPVRAAATIEVNFRLL